MVPGLKFCIVASCGVVSMLIRMVMLGGWEGGENGEGMRMKVF